ncbi:MAG TPA: Ig-like domain-containing protein [Gemmatimonadales bacterium]|nr:Ig-like domain-containing protein [Gemmatimonadales bacterium]
MTRLRYHIGLSLAATVLAVAAIASCSDSAAGPGAPVLARFGVAPAFSSTNAGIVPIAKIRFTLNRSTDSTLARDTVITIPAGTDSVALVLTVPILSNTETFALRVELITPAGDTAFRGGPVTVAPSSGDTPPVVPITLVYTGVGASAARVVITPKDTATFFGQSVVLTAIAYDSSNAPLPGTPIAWHTLDSAEATVAVADSGRVVGGVARGPARIVAQLLTGPSDTATVAVQPLPSGILADSGNAQTAAASTLLAQAAVARVVATDGLGVSGVWVLFATPDGGVLSADSVRTDSTGRARVTWGLGPLAGAQTLIATTKALPADSAIFTATATAGAPASITLSPTTLTFHSLSDTSRVTATVRDSSGLVIANPSIAWSSSDATVATVDGTGLVRAIANGSAVIHAVTGSVQDSASVGIVQVAAGLAFTAVPSSVPARVVITPPVTVAVVDSGGSTVPTATDSVTIGIGTNPVGGTLTGVTTVAAVQGVATFSQLTLSLAGTGYTFVATAPGLAPDTSAAFNVTPTALADHWVNAAGGNWSVGSNWSLGTPPQSTDTAYIDLAGNYTVTLDASTQIGVLMLGASSGADTLAIAANTLTVTSGTVGTNGVLAVNGTGTLTGSGTINVAGILDWSGGTLGGTGTVNVTGTASLSGASTLSGGRVVQIASGGIGDWVGTGSSITASGTGSSLSVLSGGSLTIDSAVSFAALSGTPTFANAGTVTVDSSSGFLYVSGGFSNQGTFNVNGILNLTNGGTSSGTLTVPGGGGLELTGGTFTVTGQLTLAQASTFIAGGGLDLSGAPTPTFAGNIVVGSGTTGPLAVTGSLPLGTTSTLALYLTHPAVPQLTVSGTATLGGSVTFVPGNGYTPTVLDTLPIITYGSRSGNFTGGVSGLLQTDYSMLDTVYSGTRLLLINPAPILFGADSGPQALTDTAGIRRVNPSGANLLQVGSSLTAPVNQYSVLNPRWSPDYTRLTYSDGHNIFIAAALPTAVVPGSTVVVESDTAGSFPRYSPDGAHLAFKCGGFGLNNVCVIQNVTGAITSLRSQTLGVGTISVTGAIFKAIPQLTVSSGAYAWNPTNAAQIAVAMDTTDPAAGPIGSRIYTVQYDGTGIKELPVPLVDTNGRPVLVVNAMDWSPDGTTLVFDAAANQSAYAQIFALNVATGTLTQLTDSTQGGGTVGSSSTYPVFSPDGSQILFKRDLDGCNEDFWRMNADGTGQVQVSNEQICDYVTDALTADWSPDGTQIVLNGFDFGQGSDLLVYLLPSTATSSTYANRVLIGQAPTLTGIMDPQASWRP